MATEAGYTAAATMSQRQAEAETLLSEACTTRASWLIMDPTLIAQDRSEHAREIVMADANAERR